MNSQYELHSRWQVACGRDTLWDELESLLASDDPMAWWGPVEVTSYDGSSLSLRAASRFGYQLTFQLSRLELSRPATMSFESVGDLKGRGVVSFADGDDAQSSVMHVDWRVATDRRWMKATGWLLRPLFVAGHQLIMKQGEKNLNAWLAER